MEDMVVRKEGLYCVPGDFYIDPWRPVARAVITHAHADHARVGHGHYLAATPGAGILRARLGAEINLQALAYGERISHNGVRLSLHPAGHVLGSAQLRMEHEGRIWVASGDYKLEPTAPAPLRAGALPRLHHRIHLRHADLPLAAATDIFEEINRGGAPTPQKDGQRAVLLFLRQGAAHPARHRCQHRAHRSATARWNRSTGCTAKPASACPTPSPSAKRRPANAARRRPTRAAW
jgi:putative mRNA 3-end processing factor